LRREQRRHIFTHTLEIKIMNPLDGHYEVVVYWKDSDGQYIAEVPELHGCFASGPTRAAAVANVEHAIELWLRTAELSGDPIPQAQGRLRFP
jgi:predicted RNase H-like HicB family nuclease